MLFLQDGIGRIVVSEFCSKVAGEVAVGVAGGKVAGGKAGDEVAGGEVDGGKVASRVAKQIREMNMCTWLQLLKTKHIGVEGDM